MPRKANKLTDKERLFCHEYLKDGNAGEAARRAGYSKNNLHHIAWETMQRPHVRDYLNTLQQKQAHKLNITAERILSEYARIAFSDMKQFLNPGNEIKDVSELDEDKTAAVESIQSDIRHDGGDSQGYTEKVKLKLHNKLEALNALAKNLGLFEANNRQIADGFTAFLKEIGSAGQGLPIKE